MNFTCTVYPARRGTLILLRILLSKIPGCLRQCKSIIFTGKLNIVSLKMLAVWEIIKLTETEEKNKTQTMTAIRKGCYSFIERGTPK